MKVNKGSMKRKMMLKGLGRTTDISKGNGRYWEVLGFGDGGLANSSVDERSADQGRDRTKNATVRSMHKKKTFRPFNFAQL